MWRQFLRKAFKKDKLIVRKTDDEMMRHLKQTTIIKERKRYEDLMHKEEERRAKGLNYQEKRLLHIRELETLPTRVYDKAYLNDNECEFSFLHDKSNYKPLNQKWRPFYWKPMYARRSDFCVKPSGMAWIIRIVGSVVMIMVGY